jgi:hypothetical protein
VIPTPLPTMGPLPVYSTPEAHQEYGNRGKINLTGISATSTTHTWSRAPSASLTRCAARILDWSPRPLCRLAIGRPLPCGADLSRWSADGLVAIAAVLNSRPRKTLDWKTPAEALDGYLQSAQASLATIS